MPFRSVMDEVLASLVGPGMAPPEMSEPGSTQRAHGRTADRLSDGTKDRDAAELGVGGDVEPRGGECSAIPAKPPGVAPAPDPRRRCRACGQGRWWMKGTQQICAVCHPPLPGSEASHAVLAEPMVTKMPQ